MDNKLYMGITGESENCLFNVDNVNFKILDLNEEVKKSIDNELEDWVIEHNYSWYYEDFSYNHIDEGTKTENIPVKDIVSMKAGSYSSTDILGAYLVDGSHFSGVILKFNSYSGYGMSSHNSEDFCVLKTNGDKLGSSYSHSGHCSSEVNEWSKSFYSLKKNV